MTFGGQAGKELPPVGHSRVKAFAAPAEFLCRTADNLFDRGLNPVHHRTARRTGRGCSA